MELSNRIIALFSTMLFLVIPLMVPAQWDKKPYTEWSEKEAAKILNDSAWGQTQVVTDTARMFDTGRRLDSGQSRVAEVSQVNFRIRLFSAKPVRQAISRSVEIQQKGELSDQIAARLRALANADFPDYIIVTVTTEISGAGSQLGQIANLLNRQTTPQLKNDTYLLVNGGKRVFLQEYQAPRNDGLGARFVFPRMLDGKPFITPESNDLLFSSQLSGGPTLNVHFKVKDMMFQGKLEY